MLLVPTLHVIDAYAYLFPPPVAVEYVNYDYDYNGVSTDGGFVKMTGVLKSNVYRDLRVSPYISETLANPGPFGVPNAGLDQLLRYNYPVYWEKGSWYFRMESNLTSPVVIKPGERISFEIRAYPLKAGVYNPGIMLMSDNGDVFYREYYGQTVKVIGSSAPTTGEITVVYLPFIIGAAVMSAVIFKSRDISKRNLYNKVEKAIRVFFGVKCGLEAIWLSGILFWFVLSGYPLLHPYEPVFSKVVGLTLVLATITASSYFAATVKSRKLWRILSISSLVASITFYFVLVMGLSMFYIGYVPTPFRWEGKSILDVPYWVFSSLPESAKLTLSYALSFILLPPLNVDLGLTIYIILAWIREKNTLSRLAYHVPRT